MPLVPNVDFTIIDTLTLTPLTYDGTSFVYNFDTYCVGTTASTSVTLCNLTPNTINFDVTSQGGDLNAFYFPNLDGLTIDGYDTYTFDISFTPQSSGTYIGTLYVFSGTDYVSIYTTGTADNSLVQFTNSGCFIDYGVVGVNSNITVSQIFNNITNRDLTISFSGNLNHFSVNNPITLIPGNNLINFIFNPQVIGNCTESILFESDCTNSLITLCGSSVVGNSVSLSIEGNTSTYVNCCSYPILHINNNHLNFSNNSITATSITYPGMLTTELTFPIVIDPFTCGIVNFDFCPLVSGETIGVINVEYIYENNGVIFTGNSEIEITLNAYTHPFSTMDISCIPFNCANVNTEAILNITNTSDQPFQFYYLFIPNNGYDFYNVFETDPSPPSIIPPLTTTGITINFNSSHLTSGTSFSDVFYLKLIDPVCCREFIKCVNVNFCPTTVTPNYGYPVNVTCYGECNGQYMFTVNDCSGSYDITWSADTMTPIVSEVEMCYIISEIGLCDLYGENEDFSEYIDQVSATNLHAGNYLITITNACGEISTHSFTITEPDPLFISINYVNPNNYCKSNIGALCGIVDSPNINPAGYVVLDKETLIKVINNDFHDIPGQVKRGYQQYDAGENQVAQGQKIDGINSFRSYVLDFFSGTFANYKHKTKKEEIITVKAWDEIVAETIGHGCCFSAYVSGGTAPYSYQWFGPNGYTAISPNIFERPCCEPYTLVVTDANGCTISATSTCLQCSFEITELITTNPTCTYSTDGSISVSVSGDCLNAVYKIELESSNWVEAHTASTYNFVNLGRDQYVLRVENIETECKLKPVNITLQPKYEFTLDNHITGTTCANYCNGILEVFVNVINNEDNIDPEFLYTLDGHGNYQNVNLFTGVCSGNHTINVMNTLNYCEVTEEIVIPNLNLFGVDTSVMDATGEKISDGEITITVENGITLCDNQICYRFENITENTNEIIPFPNNKITIKNVIPGVYYFKITDNNGCNKTFKVIVGYSKIKKVKAKLFDSKRTDTYSGSKITSNTPKGQ